VTSPPVDVVELTRQLVRFDTTNPPGNEAACMKYLAGLLTDAGLDCQLLGSHPDRPNLLARLPGRDSAPPLLWHGHLDVVPVAGQRWSRPPFAAELADGCVWGRGTVDMKGGVAMMAGALLRMAAAGERPAGTVLLALLSDEEAGSYTGAHYLVREHPQLFDGVRYAIGEDGGASIGLGGGRRLHPIVVAEKRACWLRITLRGPGGHASRVASDANPVRQLNRLLTAVAGGGLGVQPTTAVRRMLAELGAAAAPATAAIYQALAADPADLELLAGLPERDGRYLRSVLQHSVNATVIRAGNHTNVLPTEVTVELDGRLLPGAGSAEFVAALRALVPDELEVEVLVEGEPLPEPEFGPMYELLADVLRRADPDGIPVPMIMSASTDSRLFPQLGISCYGWLPMLFCDDVNYRDLMHSADERIPVEALRFGESCFYDLVRRYG